MERHSYYRNRGSDSKTIIFTSERDVEYEVEFSFNWEVDNNACSDADGCGGHKEVDIDDLEVCSIRNIDKKLDIPIKRISQKMIDEISKYCDNQI